MTRAQRVDSLAAPKVPLTWLAEVYYERPTRQEPNLSQMIVPNRRLLQIGDDLGEAYKPAVETALHLSGETPALQGATMEHVEHLLSRNNAIHTGRAIEIGATWRFTGLYQLHYKPEQQSWVVDALEALREIDEEVAEEELRTIDDAKNRAWPIKALATQPIQNVQCPPSGTQNWIRMERRSRRSEENWEFERPASIEVTGEADDLARSLGVWKDANIVLRLAQEFVPEAEHAKMTVNRDFEDGTTTLHVTVQTSAPPDEVVSAEDRLHEALFEHLTPVGRSCFSIGYDFVSRQWTR